MIARSRAFLLGALLATLAPAPAAFAQGLPIPGFGSAGSAPLPVKIEADQGVEWRQKEQLYLARGNATAQRGDTKIRGDVLTAHYRRNAENKQEIWKITAEGAVKITTPKETITGDTAEYIVETGVFTLVGRPVKIDNGKNVLTAARIDYNSKGRLAHVTGNASVTEEKRRVRAERFVAFFAEDGGKNSLKRVEAHGNVIVDTPTEVVRGDRGDYDAETGVALLTGNVRGTKGSTQITGDRAEVNMKTGISRIVADKGRVGVLLVPGDGSDKGTLDTPGGKSENNKKNNGKATSP
jgi:lipopolysaccharide export system protein LptA